MTKVFETNIEIVNTKETVTFADISWGEIFVFEGCLHFKWEFSEVSNAFEFGNGRRSFNHNVVVDRAKNIKVTI